MKESIASDVASDIEVVKSQVPLVEESSGAGVKGFDLGAEWQTYHAHMRIVQVQNVGDKIRIILIEGIDSPVKKAIRDIYEQSVNWVQWLQQRQAKADGSGHPVTGYHYVNHIVQGDSYLGQSWIEACQKLLNAGLMG
ncbi:MAG: hypothetical protein ACRC8A_05815 [Microcoleaceae cyanobacterium]